MALVYYDFDTVISAIKVKSSMDRAHWCGTDLRFKTLSQTSAERPWTRGRLHNFKTTYPQAFLSSIHPKNNKKNKHNKMSIVAIWDQFLVQKQLNFPAFAGTNLYCLVTEAHGCEQLAKSDRAGS